jgi:hypothetical protein
MIIDDRVLGRVSDKWQPPMFESSWSNMIGKWCVEYFKEYKKAPGHHIQGIFNEWAAKSQNQESIDLAGTFLDTLNEQYTRLTEDSNSDYIIDLAARYFNKVKLNRLTESIETHIYQGDIDKAVSKVNQYHRIEMGVGKPIDVFSDKEAIKASFDSNHEALIQYSGGLKDFFKDRLERDGFIAVMGPDKRGKSFWLLDMAFRAVIQKHRVAFFECGDLSEHQIMRRFMIRVSAKPLYPCSIEYPQKIIVRRYKDRKPDVKVLSKLKKYTKPLDWRTAYRACHKLVKRRGAKDRLRLSCHFNDTLTVDGLNGILEEWERDGWIPDIIIIDYADLLNMDYYGVEGRDRVDKTWKQLRRLSQERHCLVITATQSDTKAYDAVKITQKHFSEDKRKNAHVTGMIGLNQTEDDKEEGFMRLNWVVLREGNYNPKKFCYVANCLELANMSVRSEF